LCNSLKDDEQISSALGYVVHVLVLAAKYLQIPLRYEVIYCSSRSMIRDAVVGSGRALPLFKRGVERERFDRALLWLQKDVEQLMLLRGYVYDRKKSILGNLKQLFSCEMCPKLVS
jgi:UV radiation resistance-associated gene protein